MKKERLKSQTTPDKKVNLIVKNTFPVWNFSFKYGNISEKDTCYVFF